MRRLICVALVASCAALATAQDVVFVTWNMKWFPSGKADLRVSAAFEDFKVKKAGGMLADAVANVGGDRSGAVVFLQELRDRYVCEDLAARMGRPGLRVVTASRFTDKAGYPLWQQSAILSDLPVVESDSMPWLSERHVDMPRGFAYAVLDAGDALVAAFCLHLKSNLNLSGRELETQKNIYKREFASAQVLEKLRELRTRHGARLSRAVVAGDFNTNEDAETFVSEATLRAFYGAHFRSGFRGWRQDQRVTHPGRGGYPDCTFDYVLYRGFGRIAERRILPGDPISDHNIVAIRLSPP